MNVVYGWNGRYAAVFDREGWLLKAVDSREELADYLKNHRED